MPQRILIVDDDEALRESLALVLGAEGYETSLARDGARFKLSLSSITPGEPAPAPERADTGWVTADTLALATEATLKLHPRIHHHTTVLAPFRVLDEVTTAVPAIASGRPGRLKASGASSTTTRLSIAPAAKANESGRRASISSTST